MKHFSFQIQIFIVGWLICTKGFAFCVIGDNCPQSGIGWAGASATFHTKGFMGSNSEFDDAFLSALNQWNNLSNFVYSATDATADPCEPGTNSHAWEINSDYCGVAFGSSTLAISLIRGSSFSPSLNNIIDVDIIFNSSVNWDIYNGSGPKIDFSRVAVHELGHALGLGHEPSIPAIMNPLYSQSIEYPQQDDINGLVALYGSSLQNAKLMASGDLDGNASDEVIFDFSDSGIWVRINNNSWVKLHNLSSKAIATGDIDGNGQDEVIIDFGNPYGIWIWMNNGSWVLLHNLSGDSMDTIDMDGNGINDLIIDFGTHGLWVFMNNNEWHNLHSLSPTKFITGNIDGDSFGDLIVDFGSPYGIWAWVNNNTWILLHNQSAETLVTGDLDGNGTEEVIIDFGIHGIWVKKNNTSWHKLHNLSSDTLTIGDQDGNGMDDLIIDYGNPYGLWVYMNDNTWINLHNQSPLNVASGDVDGNGLSDMIINFYTFGIWVLMNNSVWNKL